MSITRVSYCFYFCASVCVCLCIGYNYTSKRVLGKAEKRFPLYLVLLAALLDAQQHLQQGYEHAEDSTHAQHQVDASQIAYLERQCATLVACILHTHTHTSEHQHTHTHRNSLKTEPESFATTYRTGATATFLLPPLGLHFGEDTLFLKLQYRLAEHIAIRPVCPKGTEERLKRRGNKGEA